MNMPAEAKKETALEIAHVLFIDIVGYSKLSISDQHAAVGAPMAVAMPIWICALRKILANTALFYPGRQSSRHGEGKCWQIIRRSTSGAQSRANHLQFG